MSRRSMVLLALLAALLRGAYFVEVSDGPHARLDLASQSDMAFFVDWAQQMAAGDWLTRDGLHPYHEWQDVVAAEAFKQRPDLTREALGLSASAQLGRGDRIALWDHWYRRPRYHQSPLYPGLIAIGSLVLGESPRWVHAVQHVLGVFSVLLIALIAARLGGRGPGLAAGLLAVGYGPLIAYESVVLRTSISVTLSLLAIWTAMRCLDLDEARSWRSWSLVGLVCGAAILLRPSNVLLLPAFILIGFLRRRLSPIELLGFVLAALAPLLPIVARNAVVGAPLLATSSVAAQVFTGSNVPEVSGYDGWLPTVENMPRILAEADGEFPRAAWLTLSSHPTVGSWIGLEFEKIGSLLGHYEKPNNVDWEHLRRSSAVLGALSLRFDLLALLALGGLVVIGREGEGRVSALPLLSLVVVSLVPLLLLVVLSRFRLPLAAVLLPLSGIGLVELGRGLIRRRAVAVVSLMVICTVLWPDATSRPSSMPSAALSCHLLTYQELLEEAASQGDQMKVRTLLSQALDHLPEGFQRRGSLVGQTPDEVAVAGHFRALVEDYLRLARWAGDEVNADRASRLLGGG